MLTPLLRISKDIKLSHSVFAMPFALLGAFLATSQRAAPGASKWPHWGELALVISSMVCARTWAMCVNRFADADIDAQNPRTAGRAVPSGAVSRAMMGTVAMLSAGGFIASCAGFLLWGNFWPTALALPVLALLGAYSYAKRFTWACHLLLGITLAISPCAAAIALEPHTLQTPTPWLLAGMIWCWVSGFDILYALQDVESDREQGVFSIPANLGEKPALWISRLLHLGAAGFLTTLVLADHHLGAGFALATAATIGLLALEHILVALDARKNLPMAFFTVNGVISLLLGAAGIWDLLR